MWRYMVVTPTLWCWLACGSPNRNRNIIPSLGTGSWN